MDKKKNNRVIPNAENGYPGGVSVEQMNRWKAEHGLIKILTVTDRNGKDHVGYLKKLGRDHAAVVMQKYGRKEIYEAGKFLLENLYIGGDRSILDDEDVSLAAAVAAGEMFDPLPATLSEVE